MSEVTNVNVVGSGAVSSEFDLKKLSSVFGSKAEYDPENYPGMYFRFENGPTITVYRTGKFIIRVLVLALQYVARDGPFAESADFGSG